MSTEITRTIVVRQLAAMGASRFDIGVLQQTGRMLLREGWSAEQVDTAIKWLRSENARGAHIFVRPHGEHALSLLDDLTRAAISEMKQSGFEPALVAETSRGNFQAWLNHGQLLRRELSTQAARELARRFGGDPSSADWRHFGRLAGFTNQKRERRLENGLAPFVKLHECIGCVYSKADELLHEVSAERAMLTLRRAGRMHAGSRGNPGAIRPLAEFYRDRRYEGDLHRADMAWALYAASRGLLQGQIQAEILRARDLSKKGRPERQVQYAQRTAENAVAAARPTDP
jgi:RepB DNA-primase N-terminal domain